MRRARLLIHARVVGGGSWYFFVDTDGRPQRVSGVRRRLSDWRPTGILLTDGSMVSL